MRSQSPARLLKSPALWLAKHSLSLPRARDRKRAPNCYLQRIWSSASVATLKTPWRRRSLSMSLVTKSQPSCWVISQMRASSRSSAGRILVHGADDICKDITETSWWARWRLKSPASRLFTQPFIQVLASRYWRCLCLPVRPSIRVGEPRVCYYLVMLE